MLVELIVCLMLSKFKLLPVELVPVPKSNQMDPLMQEIHLLLLQQVGTLNRVLLSVRQMIYQIAKKKYIVLRLR